MCGGMHLGVFLVCFPIIFDTYQEVGNIPYDATEEQLTEIFQEVGPVVSFRFVQFKLTLKF